MLQVGPTDCFLQYLEFPEEDEEEDSDLVDLSLAAVVIICHLDRLASPYLPPASFAKVRYQ